MDIVLILFCVLLIVWLAVVAIIYLLRPEYFIEDDEGAPDVDMWLAFIFALVIALLTVLVVAMLISHYCVGDNAISLSLRDIIAYNLGKTKCPKP